MCKTLSHQNKDTTLKKPLIKIINILQFDKNYYVFKYSNKKFH